MEINGGFQELRPEPNNMRIAMNQLTAGLNSTFFVLIVIVAGVRSGPVPAFLRRLNLDLARLPSLPAQSPAPAR